MHLIFVYPLSRAWRQGVTQSFSISFLSPLTHVFPTSIGVQKFVSKASGRYVANISVKVPVFRENQYIESSHVIRKILEYFKFATVKPEQLFVLNGINRFHHVIVTLPTGFGKTFAFLLPSFIELLQDLPSVAIVIVPLVQFRQEMVNQYSFGKLQFLFPKQLKWSQSFQQEVFKSPNCVLFVSPEMLHENFSFLRSNADLLKRSGFFFFFFFLPLLTVHHRRSPFGETLVFVQGLPYPKDTFLGIPLD